MRTITYYIGAFALLMVFSTNAFAGFLTGAYGKIIAGKFEKNHLTSLVMYPLYTLSYDGALNFYNNGQYSFEYNDYYFKTSLHIAEYSNTQPNGDKIYEFNDGQGPFSFKYIFSDNDGNITLTEQIFAGRDLIGQTVYNSSYSYQQKYYSQNSQYSTPGIQLNFDANNSSQSQSSRSNKNKSTCQYCNGTGYYLSPSSTPGSYINGNPLYNSNGTKCRICGKYNKHWHLECKH